VSDGGGRDETTGLQPEANMGLPDAVQHIERLIPGLAIIVSAALGIMGNGPVALGFLAGAAVAYINFRWLKNTVRALADTITQTGPPRSKPSVVLRFLTRFVLIALVAYVIFISYPLAFRGFLGGIFAPVLAIFVEAARVAYSAMRSRS
jgi:ATP synthase I chain